MVLGIDWIDTYAPIQLHTRTPGISFHKDRKKIMLKGLTKKIPIQQATKKDMRRWKKEGLQRYLVQCSARQLETKEEGENMHIIADPETRTLTEIIKEFHELFEEPKTLPPQREFDHEIPLILGAKPANSKPYRYSFDKKKTP